MASKLIQSQHIIEGTRDDVGVEQTCTVKLFVDLCGDRLFLEDCYMVTSSNASVWILQPGTRLS